MDDPRRADEREPADRGRAPAKSFGNMGPEHWSRARAGANEEALTYYRERSRAPGVAEGGAARNVYCLRCDGVVPFVADLDRCPHCGEDLSGAVQRYFNWVEINEPPASDARALLPIALGALLVLVAAGALLYWWAAS